MKKHTKKTNRTYIGGQAVLEGVMMRGKTSMVTAVRDPRGKIQVESERLTPPEKRNKFLRLPLVRGVVAFISSLIVGNKVLLRSAAVAEEEDETPSKAEKWLAEKHKIDLSGIFNFISVLLGIVLAVGLFVALPQWVTGLTNLSRTEHGGILFNLAEGGVRIGIFILYLALISLVPSLKRVFMCHGAEHKTITAYEQGLELNVENVRGCSRLHDRCGTTFLFLVMLVSILVFSLANSLVGGWLYVGNKKIDAALRFCFKLLLLPLVAGGEEAALFAAVLCRMYAGYCARKRLKIEAVDVSSTELGGVKEAVYQVSGKGAYKLLKYESGVHRVQRVPETETQGRIHTSTATVAVLPEAEDVEVEINDKDVRIDIFHSGGAGGQNVNKVASAVRLTHFPTGIVVTCQDERSQLKNKERAFQVLRSRLYDLYRGKAGREREESRRSLVGSGDRSERIRTYNYPQSRITDHRIGFSVYDMEKFLAGDLDEMVQALAIADREMLLASES